MLLRFLSRQVSALVSEVAQEVQRVRLADSCVSFVSLLSGVQVQMVQPLKIVCWYWATAGLLSCICRD